MSNKLTRERLEAINLFADARFRRQAFTAVAASLARRPADQPLHIVDKDGQLTREAQIERYTYDSLAADLDILKDPEHMAPTSLEMLIGCQFVVGRTNPAAASMLLDHMGCKPVDESLTAQGINPYEHLSDGELQLLAEHRAQMAAIADAQADAAPGPSGPSRASGPCSSATSHNCSTQGVTPSGAEEAQHE